MATSQITLTQSPSEPSIKDLLDVAKDDFFRSLNCHAVGTVQAFNAANQTATVSINYKRTFFEQNAVTGGYDPVLVDYPLLIDSPCIVLGGGLAALTFPITVGDECLVLFNDRDIDTWFQGSTGSAVATPRMHSFSDAFILVGLRSAPNAAKLTAYDQTRAVLRYGTGLVAVGGPQGNQVRVDNGLTTLGAQLQALTGQLQALTTQLALLTVTCTAPGNPSSPPVNAAALTAVGTNIGTIATQLAGLLE